MIPSASKVVAPGIVGIANHFAIPAPGHTKKHAAFTLVIGPDREYDVFDRGLKHEVQKISDTPPYTSVSSIRRSPMTAFST